MLDWLAANPVQALALQELKMADEKFPHDTLAAAGYSAAIYGQKTYNGVALLLRQPLAAEDVTRGISGFADDNARLIAATMPAPSIIHQLKNSTTQPREISTRIGGRFLTV